MHFFELEVYSFIIEQIGYILFKHKFSYVSFYCKKIFPWIKIMNTFFLIIKYFKNVDSNIVKILKFFHIQHQKLMNL